MKVAIVGGGPAGLAMYLHLSKALSAHSLPADIVIFDSHEKKHTDPEAQSGIPSLGGGYGLAPNGMVSLRRLDPDIHEEIFRKGFPTPRMKAMSARGEVLGSLKWCMDDVDGRPECCVMVLRETVLEALRKRVPDGSLKAKKVAEVINGLDCALVEFDDGTREPFDLVIGADGIWSRARRAVVGPEASAAAPEYKGLFTVAGFCSTAYLPLLKGGDPMPAPESSTIFTFGGNGMFGACPYTTGEQQATNEHIRGEKALAPGKHAFWWSRSAQVDPDANPDNDALHEELKIRYKDWKSPAIHRILENSKVVLKVPTFVLKKLPTWAHQRIVLIGDAAHAMPSSSGQGISQSFEDAEALALLLAHNLMDDQNTGTERMRSNEETLRCVQNASRQYMAIRKPHVEKLVDMGNRAGDTSRDISGWQEWFTYKILTALFWFFGNSMSKPAYNYNVLREVERAEQL